MLMNEGPSMSPAIGTIIDISLELDPRNFGMRTPAGFKRDMQFEMEVLKEHDAPGGAGQIVRGVHMRLHVGSRIRTGDRLLLRTDLNNSYDGGSERWMKESPYLTIGATQWCIEKRVVIVGYDFYHGNDEPGAPRVFHNSRTLSERGVITMPYLKNLDQIDKDRFTLVAFPLKLIGAEASPIRAVALL